MFSAPFEFLIPVLSSSKQIKYHRRKSSAPNTHAETMTFSSSQLSTLPEELLYDILQNIPTKELLKINTISHRINETIRSVLIQRLRKSQELGGYTFVFGCSTPARRVRSPIPNSSPLTQLTITQSLTSYQQCHRVGYSAPPTRDTRKPSDIYSRFSPRVRSDDPSVTTDFSMSTHCTLDEGQGFIQLCANNILVKFGPSGSLFSALARVSGETVFRLRRHELNTQESQVLWLDQHANIALRVKPTLIERRPWVDAPGACVEDGGQGPCEYDVRYEEIMVRSTYLLSVLEEGRGKCQKDGITVGYVSIY